MSRAIKNSIIHKYRIEILQDFIKKDYSCLMCNIEGDLFNNKELQDIIRKTKKVSAVLMIDGIAIEENLNE